MPKETEKQRKARIKKEEEELRKLEEQTRLKKWFDDDKPKPTFKLRKYKETHEPFTKRSR